MYKLERGFFLAFLMKLNDYLISDIFQFKIIIHEIAIA